MANLQPSARGPRLASRLGSKIEARGLFRDGRWEGARRIQGEGRRTCLQPW